MPASYALRRRLIVLLLTLLSLAPVLFVLARTEAARRNIVYWDEFDTALALLLRLKEQPTTGNFLREMFLVNNEHRMVTSRLLFAAHYGMTGSINFDVVNWVGNATLLGCCALLIATGRTTPRRLLLALILAAFLFHLAHYENFMWSGASIDHFQVVLLAAAAIACVARNTRGSVLLGAAFATLATYTLAHGLVTWAVGAVMLIRIRNRRALFLWGTIAVVVVGSFLYGFQLNRSQGFAALSLSGVLLVVQYWLTLLGAVPALGANAAAPWFGVALLLLTLWLALIRSSERERIAFPMLLFAVGALVLIAIGRAQHSGGVVFSRYYVLGAVAWAMVMFMVVTRWTHPRRPLASLVWLVPVLAVFNVAANRAFAGAADSWVECRDRAAVRYLQHGVDGRGEFVLHPAPAHSTRLLQQAERAGIYRMPSICLGERLPRKTKPSTRMFYFVDGLTVDTRAMYVTGWAALDKIPAERGAIKLVLRSDKETRVYSTVSETRPDVAKATRQPGWAASGFQFVARRERLPPGEFNIGFLIEGPDGPELSLTAHRVNLIGEGKALLASGD